MLLYSFTNLHHVKTVTEDWKAEKYWHWQGHVVDDEEDDEADGLALEDGVIKTFEDHEESVYAAAWSSADPWTLASISYDGRMVVNQVPREVKFKILNLV